MNPSLEIVRVDSQRLDSYGRLLSSYSYKPFYYYSAFQTGDLTKYFLQDISYAIQDSKNTFWGLERHGHAVGAVLCAKRPWETGALGIAAGAIGPVIVDESDADVAEIRRSLVDSAISWLKQNDVRHVTVRLDINELALLRLLEQLGFITVDGIQHFSLDLRGRQLSDISNQGQESECRIHQESDISELKRIAEQAYIHDRFHSDPAIDSVKADRAYGQWIENSCRGLDDAVVVVTSQQRPVGFMSLRVNRLSRSFFGATIGKIWLVGVEERARGKGFGLSLMRFSLHWFANQGVDVVEVGTQFRNTAAMSFYARSGFSPINPILAVRKIL